MTYSWRRASASSSFSTLQTQQTTSTTDTTSEYQYSTKNALPILTAKRILTLILYPHHASWKRIPIEGSLPRKGRGLCDLHRRRPVSPEMEERSLYPTGASCQRFQDLCHTQVLSPFTAVNARQCSHVANVRMQAWSTERI